MVDSNAGMALHALIKRFTTVETGCVMARMCKSSALAIHLSQLLVMLLPLTMPIISL